MAYNPLAQGEPDALSESEFSQLAASPSPLDDLDKRGRRSPNLELRSRSSYSDAMDHPRTVSREGSVLRHPTPDLQSLQGAYTSNVVRLEQSAERLSLSSNIDEELRKMRMEQRKPDSRGSSVLNSPIDEDEHHPSWNRQASYGYGSHASNSIVGTNNVARSGGFSPAAYFASPKGSVRSESWSHHNSVKERSASYGQRLTQLSEPEQEGKPLDSPLSSRLVPIAPQPESPKNSLRVVNNESYNLDDVEIPHIQPEESEMAETNEEPRPLTDTYLQANDLFEDFDGVHTEYHPEGQADPQENANRRVSSQPRPPSRVISYIEPVPGENMVYYPAPVPMMLNLPKRLSKLPSAIQREKRRTQLLSSLPTGARKSATWLPEMLEGSDERSQPKDDPVVPPRVSNRRTMADIPPQLRATMFFDQQTVRQDIELKEESAVATLDSILDASAFAPVSAFTDHPFAGRMGAEVYGKETVRPRASIVPLGAKEPQKRRSTINLLTKRNSSIDLPDNDMKKSPKPLRKRNSNSNILDDTKKRNSSLLSFGNFGRRKSSAQQFQDAEEYKEADAPSMHGEEAPLQSLDDDAEVVAAEESYFQDAPEEHEEQGQVEEEQAGQFIGAPSTLLAELQLRKQQQKQRNRTAATAFPNGMHSTLLQLDAVDQVQKQKRKQGHTRLAWEDPDAHQPGIENDDDEDVPLGMLFAGRKMDAAEKSRHFDEDRPLGLIARRDIEDNEPLSHRRARLRGEDPVPRNASPDKRNSMYTLDLPNFGDNGLEGNGDDAENNDEDETLGQRLRRLKATQIPVQTRPVSGDFASEMMSQFGGLPPSEQLLQDQEQQSAPRTINKTLDPEETLGQRRKRLQAEAANKSRQASGDSTGAAARPPMSKRRSMADILQAHPAAGAGIRTFSNEIKFAPAPRTRNTSWAINQTKQASTGVGLPMASGLGTPTAVNGKGNGMVGDMSGYDNGGGYVPHPMVQKPIEVDGGRRDMIDRWRQSVHY